MSARTWEIVCTHIVNTRKDALSCCVVLKLQSEIVIAPRVHELLITHNYVYMSVCNGTTIASFTY